MNFTRWAVTLDFVRLFTLHPVVPFLRFLPRDVDASIFLTLFDVVLLHVVTVVTLTRCVLRLRSFTVDVTRIRYTTIHYVYTAIPG